MTDFALRKLVRRRAGDRCEYCHCNLHKGPNIAGLDPHTGRLVRLFHPRRDAWADHFEWRGPLLLGRTPVGRVTVVVLAMNHPDQVTLREALIEEGAFPSEPHG
ncbi:MAG: HNH endonuclease [Planctomycetes bacterium]|nr:HNH endonuclease [Planctomycetota bacterium]